MKLIEVKNLVKRYGNHTAVDHLSFKVEKGQVYGFLGPNGAGKSTTMNILIGYLSANEGEVLINGHSIFDEPEEAKKYIGYLPELPPLYLDMTVKEYLKFVANLKKIPKAKRESKINEVMQMTRITEMSNRLIKHLSKGYKQRVGFAQAILGEPEIIILDEPTVGLDPKQIIEIRELIKRLGKKHTIILSSHIMQEISAVCDHILIINKGKLVACDTPERLAELNQASNELEMTIRGRKDEIIPILKSQKKVTRYEIKELTEEKAFHILVKSKKEDDLREVFFHAFAKANCPIIRMQLTSKSLEDIFLNITSGDDKAVIKSSSNIQEDKEDVSDDTGQIKKQEETSIPLEDENKKEEN